MMSEIARPASASTRTSARRASSWCAHHLLMSHLAQQRDIGDDQLVADFCRTVRQRREPAAPLRPHVRRHARRRPGRLEQLAGDCCVTELYRRAVEFFEKGDVRARGSRARADRARPRARPVGGAAGAAGRRPDASSSSMPDSYFLSTPEEVMPGTRRAAPPLRASGGGGRAAGDGDPADAHFPERDFSEFAVVHARPARPLRDALRRARRPRHEHPRGAHRHQPRRRRARRLPRVAREGGRRRSTRSAGSASSTTLREVLAGDASTSRQLVRQQQRGRRS